jgi:hypothetical protein
MSIYEIVISTNKEYDSIPLASELDRGTYFNTTPNGIPYVLYDNGGDLDAMLVVIIYFTRDGNSHYYTPLINNNFCSYHTLPYGSCFGKTDDDLCTYLFTYNIGEGPHMFDEINEFFVHC